MGNLFRCTGNATGVSELTFSKIEINGCAYEVADLIRPAVGCFYIPDVVQRLTIETATLYDNTTSGVSEKLSLIGTDKSGTVKTIAYCSASNVDSKFSGSDFDLSGYTDVYFEYRRTGGNENLSANDGARLTNLRFYF